MNIDIKTSKIPKKKSWEVGHKTIAMRNENDSGHSNVLGGMVAGAILRSGRMKKSIWIYRSLHGVVASENRCGRKNANQPYVQARCAQATTARSSFLPFIPHCMVLYLVSGDQVLKLQKKYRKEGKAKVKDLATMFLVAKSFTISFQKLTRNDGIKSIWEKRLSIFDGVRSNYFCWHFSGGLKSNKRKSWARVHLSQDPDTSRKICETWTLKDAK